MTLPLSNSSINFCHPLNDGTYCRILLEQHTSCSANFRMKTNVSVSDLKKIEVYFLLLTQTYVGIPCQQVTFHVKTWGPPFTL